MHGVEVFIEATVTGNEIHGSSVVGPVIDESGVNVFLDILVIITNSHVGIHSLSVGRTHYSLSRVKKLAKTDKSSLSYLRLKFWTFARMQRDNNSCFSARQISQNCTKILKKAARTKKLF